METIISFSGIQKGKVKIPWSVFVGAFLLNLMIFGERLLLLDLAIASATLVIFYGAFLFGLWYTRRFLSSGFTLNDEVKHITTSTGRSISYEKVKRIDVHIANDTLYANVHTGRMKRISLYSTSDLTEEQRLVEELKKRFSNVKNKTKTYRNLIRILPILSFTIPFLVMGFFTLKLYQECPAWQVVPTNRISRSHQEKLEGAKEHTINGVTFILPDGFAKKEAEQDKVVFADDVNGVFLWIDSTSLLDILGEAWSSGSTFSLALVGLQDEYDFLKLVFYSRLGFVPLLVKSALLSGFVPETIKLFHLERAPFKGFLLEGVRNKQRKVAQIWLVDKTTARHIKFMIICAHGWNQTIVNMLIEGVK